MLDAHHMCRSQKVKRTKPCSQGISGQGGELPELATQRRNKLFSTIVYNNASINAKRQASAGVSNRIKMDTRGTSVAIGPLEYCGNGIAMTPTSGNETV